MAPAPTPTPTPTPTRPSRSPSPSSTLDPKQLRALQSLNIPTATDPCSLLPPPPPPLPPPPATAPPLPPPPLPSPRQLLRRPPNLHHRPPISLHPHSLELLDCPSVAAVRFPPDLAGHLRSFTCINSLHKLTGVWLSRLQNLTDLTVSAVTVNASGPAIVLGAMKKLKSVTISHANLTGSLPKHWHLNLTHIDLSNNKLVGKIPTSLTRLENLQVLNLSSNQLIGEVPTSIGDLLSLQNLSLSSKFSLRADTHINGGRTHIDSPRSGLESAQRHNPEIHSRFERFELGIAPCDKHGLPLSPPPAKDSSSGDGSSGRESNDDDYSMGDESGKSKAHSHGPSKVVLGVAIGLSSVVFLIIFLVLISKCCR
ncbi:receptor like protein 51 [Actinidia rufa]|uniref:Receptor like protein 51 n=1 Tax=Actinidia rufa TaxID=165716 RepID=A0A7J0G8J8_9ERIC|nr:receptor like protein 51 [Actinidia rufa]